MGLLMNSRRVISSFISRVYDHCSCWTMSGRDMRSSRCRAANITVDSDSVFVVGDSENRSSSGICGEISLCSAEYVRVDRNAKHLVITLQSGDASTYLVSGMSGSPGDQLMQPRSLSKLQN
jgi:hypothetical protein